MQRRHARCHLSVLDHRFGFPIRDLTIGKMLALKADKLGDRNFMTFLPDGRKFSYRDMHLISNRIANSLAALGVKHGSHVAVMMENCPEQLHLYFALGKLGAVAVPVNTAARGQLLRLPPMPCMNKTSGPLPARSRASEGLPGMR